MSTATVINGDARRLPLADGSVHCCICSPPYYGLRDYGTATWEGGSEGCDHVEMGHLRRNSPGGFHNSDGRGDQQSTVAVELKYRDVCGKCGARRVDRQIGLEATPDEFVAAMVGVFREVRRVLRDDGTCWLNLGDSYGNGSSGGTKGGQGATSQRQGRSNVNDQARSPGQSKQLQGIPWRVALALQADGWCLRSDIVWAKPNPMPESVTDRPTKSHEHVFLLAKCERYYWDQEAVREPSDNPDLIGKTRNMRKAGGDSVMRGDTGREDIPYCNPSGRNIRSVWFIPTESFPGSHFATYPRALVERCVKAGTSERGCCPTCGAPWERETKTEFHPSQDTNNRDGKWGGNGDSMSRISTDRRKSRGINRTSTLGWRPTCSCFGHFEEITPEPGPDDTVWTEPRPYKVYVPHGPQPNPVPAVVFDPFTGSGTTGVVATGLNRRFVGVELSPDYCRMAVRRISRPHASHRTARKEESHPLFAGVTE